MKHYICLAPEPWGVGTGRTQQLMSRLRDVKILYFEPPCPGRSRAHREPGRKVRPNVTVYTLPHIPTVDEKHRFLFTRGQRRLARFILAKAEAHRFRDYVLWCSCPQQVHLLDELNARAVLYDCDRDWPHLPPEWESDLALAAEVVFAASPGLVKHLSPCNDNIALLPGGVNYPMFSREDLETPPPLRNRINAILGCIQDISRDTDLSGVLRAAHALPHCDFLFLGAVEDHPLLSTLEALPNVVFAGEQAPAELPDYLGCFTVCLDLLRQRDVGNDVIPERMYQYLSAGKPIVSMLWEEQVEDFPDVVYAAHSAAEFARLCARALAETGDWAKTRRREYGAGAAWSERADQVCRILGTIGLY